MVAAATPQRVGNITFAGTALASWRRFVFNGGSFMRISDFIARTVTQRRALVWCGVAAADCRLHRNSR